MDLESLTFGLNITRKKQLVKWYLEHEPEMIMRGNLKAYIFLDRIKDKYPDFYKRALRRLFRDDEEGEEEEIPPEILEKILKGDGSPGYR